MKVQFYASFKKLMMAALFTSVTSRSERVAIQPDYYKTAESTRSATGSAGRIVARLLTSSLRSALLLVVATGILLYGAEAAGAQTTITPEPESRFWIEGTSNVNSFSCIAEAFQGGMVIEPELPEEMPEKIEGDVILELKIPVLGFECGKRRMNRDINRALKSDSHPFIHFEYHNVRVADRRQQEIADGREQEITDGREQEITDGREQEITDSREQEESFEGRGSNWLLEVEGVLTVAGTSRTITFNAEGAVLDEKRVRVRGHKEILMTDYNIEPPTALLGVVRAQDELTVYFDIQATIH